MNLAEMRPGQEYALLLEVPSSESVKPTFAIVFTGVAAYAPDDFLAAGVLKHYLESGTPVGIALNETDADDWFEQLGTKRSSSTQE